MVSVLLNNSYHGHALLIKTFFKINSDILEQF